MLASRAITRDKPSMETIAAPVAETPMFPAGPRKFTAENAKAMQLRSAEAKKRNASATKAKISAMEAEIALARPLLAAAAASTLAATSGEYVAQRLSRTRAQIEALDVQLLASDDHRAIQAISVAIRNLAEIERVLAGRPLPGSRRPGREKPVRGSASESPAVDE